MQTSLCLVGVSRLFPDVRLFVGLFCRVFEVVFGSYLGHIWFDERGEGRLRGDEVDSCSRHH